MEEESWGGRVATHAREDGLLDAVQILANSLGDHGPLAHHAPPLDIVGVVDPALSAVYVNGDDAHDQDPETPEDAFREESYRRFRKRLDTSLRGRTRTMGHPGLASPANHVGHVVASRKSGTAAGGCVVPSPPCSPPSGKEGSEADHVREGGPFDNLFSTSPWRVSKAGAAAVNGDMSSAHAGVTGPEALRHGDAQGKADYQLHDVSGPSTGTNGPRIGSPRQMRLPLTHDARQAQRYQQLQRRQQLQAQQQNSASVPWTACNACSESDDGVDGGRAHVTCAETTRPVHHARPLQYRAATDDGAGGPRRAILAATHRRHVDFEHLFVDGVIGCRGLGTIFHP